MLSPSCDTRRGEATHPGPHGWWDTLSHLLQDPRSQVGGSCLEETAKLWGIGWVHVWGKACHWRGDGVTGDRVGYGSKVSQRGQGQFLVTREDWGHQGVRSVEGQLGSSSGPKATRGPPRASRNNHWSN